MPKKPKVHVLSIYLLREGVVVADALRQRLRKAKTLIGDLYVQQHPNKAPKWLRLFQHGDSETLDLYNASSGAALVVERGTRTYVLCFGHGRYLLEPGSYEENFGLRVTLNRVDPLKLKSLDKRTFDAHSCQTRTQASREGDVAAFGMDINRDVLRAATGVPKDGGLGRRMSGMDCLAVSVATTLAEIPALLDEFGKAFDDTSYREHFGWIDHIAEVREPAVRERLDGRLMSLLQSGKYEEHPVWMAIPELVEWTNFAGVQYSPAQSADNFHDVHLRDFLATLREEPPTLELLRKRKVYGMSADEDKVLRKWSAYSCLYAELEESGTTFLLTDGKWYRIDRDFVSSVNQDVAGLVGDIVLPPYQDANEADYNKRVAESSAGTLALLDKALVRIGGSTVEVCDLYSRAGRFVHVKRYIGSSVLSHLFAQGVVSAYSFADHPAYRAAFNDRLPVSHQLVDVDRRPRPGDYEVVYAVISRSAKPINQSLPFFSRLNLRNAARQLAGYGFKVFLIKIADQRGR